MLYASFESEELGLAHVALDVFVVGGDACTVDTSL